MNGLIKRRLCGRTENNCGTAAGDQEIDHAVEHRQQLCGERLNFVDDDDAVAELMETPYRGHFAAEHCVEKLNKCGDDEGRFPTFLKQFNFLYSSGESFSRRRLE